MSLCLFNAPDMNWISVVLFVRTLESLRATTAHTENK